MFKKLIAGFAFSALCFGASGAQAITIFEETFEGEAVGVPAAALSQFTIDSGSVDVVASGTFSITCAGGSTRCLDLDGTGASGSPASEITSTALGLESGRTYELVFEFSGNQRNSTSDNFEVAVSDGLFFEAFGPISGTVEDFTTITRTFTATSTQDYFLSFSQTNSADNIGIVIDNVKVSLIPEPSTWIMMILGFGLVGLQLQRKRRTAQAIA